MLLLMEGEILGGEEGGADWMNGGGGRGKETLSFLFFSWGSTLLHLLSLSIYLSLSLSLSLSLCLSLSLSLSLSLILSLSLSPPLPLLSH